ncbi:phosphoribosyltransferase family protein [Geodermatophilus poikilotrophus]|uniref:Putative phosphoribosyl transferase n=1 Tax=Geodermatophilus poikilotrophus TaxID=1333667 RepID=A0A1I0DRP8_9ACTN|nr:phosphoribosyltransferase family protein [Geodermatophilus poikilotrophus]SET35248.1 putative phosphoribosyl transferase [Geodermatophilus poikilotrophus]
MPFQDRRDAGRQLGRRMASFAGRGVVVLGLPRGGVPVAAEVARAVGAPLDVVLVRKLGLPQRPELAMGAVGEDGVVVVNDDVVRAARVEETTFADVERRERAELNRRARQLRGDRARLPLEGRTAVVVDDGIATGATARAACAVARSHGAARVVLAVPVGSPRALQEIAAEVDEVVCLESPQRFTAVGQAYADFRPTEEEEVLALLHRPPPAPPGDAPTPRDDDVVADAGPDGLPGHLTVPEHAGGLVVFAHGSGSGRHSLRNRAVAEVLVRAGMATLLVDLLTPAEEAARGPVFDVALLAGRLTAVARWAGAEPACAGLPLGYFGASTGAAAALVAAARDDTVRAVVSRGGRPDLAGPALAEVRAPTLLVVGGHDQQVLELNREAQARLRCASRLAVVPGASHLFEEPGTLRAAAELARDWFATHLVPVAPAEQPARRRADQPEE